jgi:PAS domain S-box-containing protein
MVRDSNGQAHPADAIRLLHEYGHGPHGQNPPPHIRAEWDAAIQRLKLVLLESGETEVARLLREPSLLEQGIDGYLVTDSTGIILEADKAVAALLSARREFLVGKPFPLFLAEGQRRPLYALLARCRGNPGALHDWRARLRARPGDEPVAISLSMVPILNQDQGVRLRWRLRDLNRTTWAERAFRAERAFADCLLDAAAVIVLVLDGAGKVVRGNAHARTVTGLPEHELIGRDWSALLPAGDRPRGRDAVLQALGSGASKGFVGGVTSTATAARLIAWSVRLLPDSEVGGVFLLVLGHDVTDLQQAQQRAVQAERLAAIGHTSAALAHESRNLLQSSQACLERLRWRLADQPEALDLVRRVQNAQKGLARLFDDVRLYAAPLKLDLGPCHLAEVWREAWAEARADCPDKEAELSEDTGEVDPWCTADRFRICCVFRNILDNALAVCASPVRVRVVCREANLAGQPAVRISVRDNGPGLNEEQRQRIFEPFYTTRARGSGLGMAIARRIMDAHHGSIGVGPEGPGAEIVLLLPRAQP